MDEVRLIQSVQPLVRQYIEEIVDGFYQTITGIESLQAIITSNSTVERLRQTLKSHLIEMSSGRIDEEYLQKRMRVADEHSRIGLEPKWYMGAFQNLQNTLMLIVNRNVEDREESLRISKAITKILNFEQQIVLEAYEKENVRQRQLQYEQVQEELKRKINHGQRRDGGYVRADERFGAKFDRGSGRCEPFRRTQRRGVPRDAVARRRRAIPIDRVGGEYRQSINARRRLTRWSCNSLRRSLRSVASSTLCRRLLARRICWR
ncbi:hypothetical protein GZH47_28090 [Paenibacillus rhizovicinus]|uniref:Globin-sensor domain-containing protein n=1 Tax=Paenibacillus rhizovicinus TaxID=2704463 RepID=A0A6C0P6W8_9BACL|nr:hypothetical protein GZH47_28090 [Paenibacillus rhizovicinus]